MSIVVEKALIDYSKKGIGKTVKVVGKAVFYCLEKVIGRAGFVKRGCSVVRTKILNLNLKTPPTAHYPRFGLHHHRHPYRHQHQRWVFFPRFQLLIVIPFFTITSHKLSPIPVVFSKKVSIHFYSTKSTSSLF